MEDFPEPQWGSMSTFSNGDLSPTRSPSFPTLMHPGTASDGAWDSNDKRPSGSAVVDGGDMTRSNGKTLNKITSFFGEEPLETHTPQLLPPNTSMPVANGEYKRPGYARQLSLNGSKRNTPESPDTSRPRTPPQASSDVTPWVFQNHEVSKSLRYALPNEMWRTTKTVHWLLLLPCSGVVMEMLICSGPYAEGALCRPVTRSFCREGLLLLLT